MRFSRTTLAALAATIVVLAGCSRKNPVLTLLDKLEDAVEDKSADEVRDLVTADFRGQGGINRAEAIALLRGYLAAYEKVEVDVYDVSVPPPANGAADITFKADFSGQALSVGGLGGLLPPGATYRFDLHVVDQNGTWRVRRATWEEVALPAEGR